MHHAAGRRAHAALPFAGGDAATVGARWFLYRAAAAARVGFARAADVGIRPPGMACSLSEFVEKPLGRDEIGAIESFGEFLVRGPQEARCCFAAHRLARHSKKTGGRAQFPRRRLLQARPRQRLPEQLLGIAPRCRCAGLRDQLALYAQKFGDVPILVVALRSRQRLVDRHEC
jgi:hypothetical protein